MSKYAKRILFYTAVAVFLVISYVVILYAQGYKYSFTEGRFQRTGAIALKADISARVYLDDRLEGGTSFLGNSYSINGLLPGKYKLSVQKDGYASWTKTFTVEEGFVVDFPSIMLLPEEGEDEQKLFEEVASLFKELSPIPTISPTPKPSNTKTSPSPEPQSNEPYLLDPRTNILYRQNDSGNEVIAENVKGFRLSKNKNKLAWWSSNELWVIWLNDTNYQPYYKSGDKELITRFQIPITNGAWFRNEDHVILELEQKDSLGRTYSIYRVVEIDKRGGVNIVEL